MRAKGSPLRIALVFDDELERRSFAEHLAPGARVYHLLGGDELVRLAAARAVDVAVAGSWCRPTELAVVKGRSGSPSPRSSPAGSGSAEGGPSQGTPRHLERSEGDHARHGPLRSTQDDSAVLNTEAQRPRRTVRG
jgi:hypothetical protein